MKPSNKLFKYVKNVLLFVISLLFIAWLLETFGAKGLLGYFIIVSFFGLYKLYVFRDQFFDLLRQIESVLFGKPLDKVYWKGEKPKLRKMRLRK